MPFELKSEDMQGRLIPAAPVPMDGEGRVHVAALQRYIDHIATQPVGGVAVWAHTGRGLHLSDEQRAQVLEAWRAGMGPGRVVIAAAGPALRADGPDRVVSSARAMARAAADLGADALLVYPPTVYGRRPDRDSLVLDYHEAIAREGLPLIVFYLYEAAGGLPYSEALLAALLSRDEVIGIKVATLDSVMTFQDIAALLAANAPTKRLISGEDRFLGYSLLCGADAALIGLGAVCPAPQVELLAAHLAGDADRFLALCRRVDDFGRHIFAAPMEGYVGRLLACLALQGVIPWDAANDPWGAPLVAGEIDRLRACLERVCGL
jgi:4-hydroxy-tetrahydrodipicolinate synthase